ncbi:Transmembrane protein 181 [Eumeta japonica]|uniref:Transmembrane protein 181 n=1 Tax=Eumeta variegata TaxID=151549 RepID=A0A4C1ZAD9_EUMVA|nr:Transmembrane protein 181 [Eumeta japonica]
MTHCRVPPEPSARARARNKRSLFHSIGRCVRVEERQQPNTTYTTQHLKCKRRVCEEVMVLHLGALEYTHYILNMRFYGLQEFHKRYRIREINFYCWFAHCLRKYSTQDWAIEQKWLSILLPLLLLYNDPIYPLRLVSSSCFAPLMDTCFQTLFLACILLSWLALYHGLRQEIKTRVVNVETRNMWINNINMNTVIRGDERANMCD